MDETEGNNMIHPVQKRMGLWSSSKRTPGPGLHAVLVENDDASGDRRVEPRDVCGMGAVGWERDRG